MILQGAISESPKLLYQSESKHYLFRFEKETRVLSTSQ